MGKYIRLDSLVRNIPFLAGGMPLFVERMLREIPEDVRVANQLASAFMASYMETVSKFDEVRISSCSPRLPESERFVRLLSDVLVPPESFTYTGVPLDLMQNLEAGNTIVLAINHPSAFDGAAIVQLIESVDPALYDRMVVVSNAKHMTRVKGTLHNAFNRVEIYPDRYFGRCNDEGRKSMMRSQNFRALRGLSELVREDGRLILLFPEGRVDNHEIAPPGAYEIFRIVYNNSPDRGTLLPAYITGSEDITPCPLFFYPFLARLVPSAVNVRIGESVPLDGIMRRGKYTPDEKQIFIDDVMARIAGQQGLPDVIRASPAIHTMGKEEDRIYRPLATTRKTIRSIAFFSNMPQLGDEIISHPILIGALANTFPDAEIVLFSRNWQVYEYLDLPATKLSVWDDWRYKGEQFDLLICADPRGEFRETYLKADTTINLTPKSLIWQMIIKKVHDLNIFQKLRKAATYNGQRLYVHPLANGREYFVYDAVLGAVYDLGLDAASSRSTLRLNAEGVERRNELLGYFKIIPGQPYSVLNPFASSGYWPGFEEVAGHLSETEESVLVLGGGPNDLDNKIEAIGPFFHLFENCTFADDGGNVYNCINNLGEIPLILSGARQFVSLDTSAVHMAVALDTPTIAIYQDTSRHRRWIPRFVSGDQFRAVYTPDFNAVTYNQIRPRLSVLTGAKNG